MVCCQLALPRVYGAAGDPEGQGPFYDRMRELGWVCGRDFVTERRFTGGHRRPQPVHGFHQKKVADLALKHRLPTISDINGFATQGGLMSYGFKFADNQRSAAEIVDKLLRGAKAGDIPIQQPTTFQLAINLKTAKALGLTIPSSLLVRADEVIQ